MDTESKQLSTEKPYEEVHTQEDRKVDLEEGDLDAKLHQPSPKKEEEKGQEEPTKTEEGKTAEEADSKPTDKLIVNVTEESRMRGQLTYVIANIKNDKTVILKGKGATIPKCTKMLDIVNLRIDNV